MRILNFEFSGFFFFLGKEKRLNFFGFLNPPRNSGVQASTGKEQTLGIIKPDGLLSNYTDKIKNVILDSGFVIRNEVSLQLDEDSVRTFYAEHSSKSFFNSLITYMTRYL